MLERTYFAYILASKSRTLYVGVTSDLQRRVFQHKTKIHPGFTARYNCNRLVWFERFADVSRAIQCEKELKGWTRLKKVALIEGVNPTWEDLSALWYPQIAVQLVSGEADPSLRSTAQTLVGLRGSRKPPRSG